MATYNRQRTAYGFSSPLSQMAAQPIVAERAPTANDKGVALGQIWVNKASNIYYILTSVSAGASEWTTTATGSTTGDLNIVTDGSITISSTEDTIGAVAITTAGGTSETLVINSTLGTSVNSVDIGSDSGGVLISAGLASAEAIALSAGNAAGGILLDAGATPGVTISNGTQSAQFLVGTGVPSISAAQGSLYMRVDGSSTSTRLYINTDGATTWTNIVTAA